MTVPNNNTYNLCCLFHDPEKTIGKSWKGFPVKYQTITYSSFKSNPDINRVISIWQNNLLALSGMIDYCHQNKIGLRVSSSLFPLATHPAVEKQLDYKNCRTKYSLLDLLFTRLSKSVADTGVRLSMHPGQFNVLESEDSNVSGNAVKELNWHGWFLDQVDCPRSHWSPINLHIHTSKGDFHSLSGRFIRGFTALDDSAKSRLTIENNDKGDGCGKSKVITTPWHCENLLKFREVAKEYTQGIPLCYDNLHDSLLRSPSLSPEDCFKEFYKTWQVGENKSQIIPVFHHSESADLTGITKPCRSHADLPSFIPKNYGLPVHWDVELKHKQIAINCLTKGHFV